MKRTVLIIMILTIISQIFGFGRDLTLAYFYGTSNISDVYLISLTIVGVLFGFIGKGISTSYIPLYSEIEDNQGFKDGIKFTNNLINLLLVFCTIVVLLGLILTESIVKLFALGFDSEALSLATIFTRISLISIYSAVLIRIFTGYLRIKNSFFIPALIGIPMNLMVVLSIIVSYGTDVRVLAFGYVTATFFQLLVLIFYAFRKGYSYKPTINIKDKNIKRMIIIAIPVIIGASVNQINTVVDRTIASQVSVGGISALNYANTLNGFVLAVFVTSISTVMYPLISKMSAKKNIKGLKDILSQVIIGVTLLVVPATIGSMILSEPIVEILFGRGAFDSEAISMTAYALFFYSIGLIGFALREVISQVFYSLQDSKTPMINAAIAMIMNIILNIILSRFLGIGGLALATSISAIFCTLLLMISLRRKIGPFGMKNIFGSLIKIIIASILMGVGVKIVFSIILTNVSFNISLIVSIAFGIVLYIAMIYLMKIKEVADLIIEVKGKFNKGSV